MVLGVPFDAMGREEAEQRLRNFLLSDTQTFVATPNPEMLVLASSDPDFQSVLKRADMTLVDGYGIVLAGLSQGVRLRRFTGVDATLSLARIGENLGCRMLLLGGLHDADAPKAAEALREVCPRLDVRGISGGLIQKEDGVWTGGEEAEKEIQSFAPHILAASLGHGKQERWICDHLGRFPSVKIAIGVGGAVEFLSGRQKRAPHWLRAAGLEWLYRLLRGPKRFARIFRATILFPALVIRSRIRSL